MSYSLLTENERKLLEVVTELARGPFAKRAAGYDREMTFPLEDLDDLFRAGLSAPTVPVAEGGLGLGPLRRRSLPLWLITKELARADLSLARCYEGHGNSLLLIDGLGTSEQRRRYFAGAVERGERWVAWSGEPQSRAAGESHGFGTRVERVTAGYRISGTKAFATSAGGADWALLLVNTDGPGGARHGNSQETLMVACRLSDPTITVDPSWWNPIGMRATVSHAVKFEGTFIPDTDVLGVPGQFQRENWQTYFVPQYAASFLGGAEAAAQYALTNLKAQSKTGDPFVQQRVAQIHVKLETGRLWLEHVARLFDEGKKDEAQVAGSAARHLLEHLALEVVDHVVRACGARSLNAPSPVERILRDLSIYVRHDNDDQILASLGRAILGLPADMSFYRP